VRGVLRPRDRLAALRELRDLRELALIARIVPFAATVPLLMRLPLPRVAALVVRSPRSSAPPADIERLAALVALAPRVAHPLVRTGCLTRGVTLFWLLRRRGYDVELRFGVDPGAADGHCWLALGGEPFLERVDPRPRFAELYRLPLPA
jgi:Transglutaminase-like superfamily